jgi:hypothetical protein
MVCAGGKLIISRWACEKRSSADPQMEGCGVVGDDDEDVVIEEVRFSDCFGTEFGVNR